MHFNPIPTAPGHSEIRSATRGYYSIFWSGGKSLFLNSLWLPVKTHYTTDMMVSLSANNRWCGAVDGWPFGFSSFTASIFLEFRTVLNCVRYIYVLRVWYRWLYQRLTVYKIRIFFQTVEDQSRPVLISSFCFLRSFVGLLWLSDVIYNTSGLVLRLSTEFGSMCCLKAISYNAREVGWFSRFEHELPVAKNIQFVLQEVVVDLGKHFRLKRWKMISE